MLAVYLTDQKVPASPLPRPHLRVGSEDKGILLVIPAYLRSSKGKRVSSFFFLWFCVHGCCIWGGCVCVCIYIYIYISISLLAAAYDFATLLLLLCFPLHHSVLQLHFLLKATNRLLF